MGLGAWEGTLLDPSVGGESALSSKILDFYSSRATFLTERRGVCEISVRRSIYRGPTDRRPTTDLSILKISNDHISTRGRPIHFMFGSTVGFSASADGATPSWTKFSKYVGENNARRVIRLVTI